MRYKYTAKWYFLLMLPFITAATHHPQDFLNSIAGSKDEGQKIVAHFCANCHAAKPVIPLGAPRIGNKGDWHIRVKNGLDNMLKNTDEGYNSMPARGGCFECSEEQLRLAIIAMLPEMSKDEVQ